MNTSFKKVVAGVTAVTIVAMNMAVVNAAVVFTGAITGGANTPTNINSTWDGLATPSGTTASGSDTVLVSAQVAPTLSMIISTGAINFGTLVPGNTNSQSLTLTTATNAKDGITVKMDSVGLSTGGAATDKFIGVLGRASAVATTAGTDTYEVQSSVVNGGTPLGRQDVAGTQNLLVANNVAKSNDVITVDLMATAQAQTEAGNYNDTVTFTVTGNF